MVEITLVGYCCHTVLYILYVKLFSAVVTFVRSWFLRLLRVNIYFVYMSHEVKSLPWMSRMGAVPHNVVDIFLEMRFWPGWYFPLTHWKIVATSDINTPVFSWFFLFMCYTLHLFLLAKTVPWCSYEITTWNGRNMALRYLRFAVLFSILMSGRRMIWVRFTCVCYYGKVTRTNIFWAMFNRFFWNSQRWTYPRFMGS